MRSPFPTPGRNKKLENIWQSLSGFVRSLLPGQQRSLVTNPNYEFVGDATSISRRYDLEIEEYPVRDPIRATMLIEMLEYCPEVATSIDILRKSCLLSDDGDDFGFTIATDLNDKSPVNPEVYKVLMNLVETVLYGQTLEPAVDRMLGAGDCFAVLGTDRAVSRLTKVLFLPTWEMFRIEDNKGELLGFQQRRNLADANPIQFHPINLVHWRYRRKTLYGRALFRESAVCGDWERLKAATNDLANGARAIGINPTLHIMPPCTEEAYRKEYKRRYEERMKVGIVTDFYLMNGADLRKLSDTNPDLKALIDTVQLWRSRIVMKAQIPPWMFGLGTEGAREIAGQPALFFARHVNDLRTAFSTGLRHIFNLELALHGFRREEWRYRIIYPKIYVDPLERQDDPVEAGESNASGIEDLDFVKINSNGNGSRH